VVAETWDGYLNDTNGFHVKETDVLNALQTAASGPLAEGNVGGGTGMICYDFKGGTGTSSRILTDRDGGYRVGVLVQANFGVRGQLQIAGVPVGKEITGHVPFPQRTSPEPERGSIIVVVATAAPLLPHQLKRVARRAALGIARTGGMAGNNSGDIFICFSTANAGAAKPVRRSAQVKMLPNDQITPLFEATAWATEEAIINALMAAETLKGIDGHTAYGLPQEELKKVLRKYRRLST